MKGKLHTEEFPNSVTDREEWNHDRNSVLIWIFIFRKT